MGGPDDPELRIHPSGHWRPPPRFPPRWRRTCRRSGRQLAPCGRRHGTDRWSQRVPAAATGFEPRNRDQRLAVGIDQVGGAEQPLGLGSVEQRASTSPLAEVRYSGRPIRRCGNGHLDHEIRGLLQIEHGEPKPPSVIRGTVCGRGPSDADLRGAQAYCLPRCRVDGAGVNSLRITPTSLRSAPPSAAMISSMRIVDVEAGRQHGDERIGVVEQLAVGRAERHRRAVEDDEIIAAGGARLRDRLADGVRRLASASPWPPAAPRCRSPVSICARGLAADREPAKPARLALAGAVDLVRERVRLVIGVDHQHPGPVARGGEREIQRCMLRRRLHRRRSRQ